MIYLDNNASTRMDEQVLEEMLPYLIEDYGNASSLQHKWGRKGHQAIEKARTKIAHYLGASPREIFFTSGATESINTILRGVFERYQTIGNHIITAKTEHKAVLTTLEKLEKKGASITYLPIDQQGNINLSDIEEAISKETILICLMHANNETGVIHPVEEIARIANEKGILFFSDTTQAIGKLSCNYSSSGVDICCFSAHKVHGPKGIGGIYIRRKSRPVQIEPLITGGKQENAFRGGTYNTAAIVGMGKAFELAQHHDNEKVAHLRNLLEQLLTNEIEDVFIHAIRSKRLSNTSNMVFKHVRSAELMSKLQNIALSSGSACVSGDRDPSHVLLAMNMAEEDALCSIRFSLSKYTTEEEIHNTVKQVKSAVETIREESPIWQMYKAKLIQ